MAIDLHKKLYACGEGKEGALGLGDARDRLKVCPVISMNINEVHDVSCGDRFSVIIVDDTDEVQEARKPPEFIYNDSVS